MGSARRWRKQCFNEKRMCYTVVSPFSSLLLFHLLPRGIGLCSDSSYIKATMAEPQKIQHVGLGSCWDHEVWENGLEIPWGDSKSFLLLMGLEVPWAVLALPLEVQRQVSTKRNFSGDWTNLRFISGWELETELSLFKKLFAHLHLSPRAMVPVCVISNNTWL